MAELEGIRKQNIAKTKKHWIKWCDWRWGNATMMAGSYDNLSQEWKFRVMDACYDKGHELGVDKKEISDFIGNNNFGWKVPRNE